MKTEASKKWLKDFWKENWKELMDEPGMTKAQVMAESEDLIWYAFLQDAFDAGFAAGKHYIVTFRCCM